MILARAYLLLIAAALAGGCATPNYLPRVRTDAFANTAPPPSVYVASPALNVGMSYGVWTSRETLVPYIDKAHEALLGEYCEELNARGYRASGNLIDFDELPKDDAEELLRQVIAECFDEFRLVNNVLLQNLSKEHAQPLDYSLGRKVAELAGMLQPPPDWILFVDGSAYVHGILPYSEGPKTTGRVLALAIGVGLAPPEYDYIIQRAALVESKTGQVLWFNNRFYYATSLVFPNSRRQSVRNFFSGLPPAGAGAEAGKVS